MVAELPPDKMPPPQPTAITRFQRLFRVAAELELGKADLERYEEFLDRRIYSLLVRGEANAKWSGDLIIEPWNVPITAGLQECIKVFEKMDETMNCSRSSIGSRSGRRSDSFTATKPKGCSGKSAAA